MDLRQLRYFVAIVRHGSFAKAAQVLGVASPTLSLLMATLETELGTPLLEMDDQGARPTRAGEVLMEEAIALLASADALRQRIAQLRLPV